MLFKTGLSIALSIIGLSSSASAQGAADWAGFYVGGTLGFGDGASEHCDDAGCLGGAPTFPQADPSGGVAGITLGYNFAAGSNWVLGVEGDWSFSDMSGSSPGTGTFGCGGGASVCETDIDHFGTLRMRAGYAMGDSLLYGTAGVAFTEYSSAIAGGTGSSSNETSAVYGLGMEHAINPKWTVKGEALFMSDPGTIIYAPGTCSPPGCGTRNNQYFVFRFGGNYRF